MKVLPFKIPKPEQNALVFQKDFGNAFYDKLHQHEEIQISLIIEGEGTLIVGDTVNYYSKGDVLVIGSNAPHVFKSDTNASRKAHMLSLFFTVDAFGKGFFELEDLHELRLFFKQAKQGFKIKSKLDLIHDMFMGLENASKLKRFITLFKILKISLESDNESLSSFVYDKKYSDNEGNRMRNVFEYTMNNYRNNISLDAIANVANMTKNAFCKYFKKRTRKSYIEFLNELRVSMVCKMMLESELNISEIAYSNGFNNLGHFTKTFKKIKGMNPLEYKKKYRTSVFTETEI